jgi:glycosyltransferase involved in cell wall biosynthesis
VTLYDLIPLIFADHYLRDQRFRVSYDTRLELIRQADQILAISQATAVDAIERLNVPAERVHVIHAGVSDRFARMYTSPHAAWRDLARHFVAIRPGFLLYVGGFDFRKNLEGVIAGYARLPGNLRAEHQLVIACRMQPEQMATLRQTASSVGVSCDQLVLTGYVTDAQLGALYHACALFVFPSLYEGSGLPILEAMSCGVPVAGSSTSSSPELLGDTQATFDPRDPDSIATCLRSVISSPATLDALREHSRKRVSEYTWRRVAEQSIEAYERGLDRGPRRRRRRPRIALVTPWLPEPSELAGYNDLLVAELAKRIDVDVVVGGTVEDYPAPRQRSVTLLSVHDFERLSEFRHHDRIVYCMGNSGLHRHVYELLRRRAGAVVLHDVQLAGFYRWYSERLCPQAPDEAFEQRIEAMYGSQVRRDATGMQSPGRERDSARGVYMTREVQRHAEECFVHSRFARDVLEVDRGAVDRHVPVSVLPYGLHALATVPRAAIAGSPLVVSVGAVHELEDLTSLIDAFALLAVELPTARLVLAGGAGQIGPHDWDAYVGDHAPCAQIEISGQLSAGGYDALLATADLALHLQPAAEGRTVVSIADCVARGLPTIVAAGGWARELPDSAVAKVPVDVGPLQLKTEMQRLLTDLPERRLLSERALAHASSCSFGHVANAWVHALGLE